MAWTDTHWGHLATKPLQSLVIFALAQLLLPTGVAVAMALVLPATYSGIRKQIKWPGSMTSAIGWKDLAADTWAAALPFAFLLPPTLWWLFGVGLVVLLVGLHKWALP